MFVTFEFVQPTQFNLWQTNKKNPDSFQMGSWLQLIVHFIHKLIELSMTIFGGVGRAFTDSESQ